MHVHQKNLLRKLKEDLTKITNLSRWKLKSPVGTIALSFFKTMNQKPFNQLPGAIFEQIFYKSLCVSPCDSKPVQKLHFLSVKLYFNCVSIPATIKHSKHIQAVSRLLYTLSLKETWCKRWWHISQRNVSSTKSYFPPSLGPILAKGMEDSSKEKKATKSTKPTKGGKEDKSLTSEDTEAAGECSNAMKFCGKER
ncbi:hypothetical protein WN51_05905 [Melipona quadrifasciata]|uniref:Uncharacterized protein n=1 Tax=Melipona quadrifasciata TaxID=166423 RepID=A0A0M9A646_9HYME|nr:hypothetical protein WN51_05905 [Melipona quadrifasciata]